MYTYGRSKKMIEQRRKKYKQQLEQIENEINELMKEKPRLTETNQIMMILTNFVQADQYQLRIELERRKGMLKLDAQDHQLVQTFYELKPRQSELDTFSQSYLETDLRGTNIQQ